MNPMDPQSILPSRRTPRPDRLERLFSRVSGLLEIEALGLASRNLTRLLRLPLDPASRVGFELLRVECDQRIGRADPGLELLQSRQDLGPAEAMRLQLLTATHLALTGQSAAAFRQVVPILRRTGSFDEPRALAASAAGLALYRAGHYTWAKRAYQGSAAYFRLAKRPVSLARALGSLALVAKSQARLDVALEHLEEAAHLLRDYPRSPARMRLLNNQGICLQRMGELGQALAVLEEASGLATSLGVPEGIASTSNNLGNVARAMGNHAAAERYYERALAIWRGLGVERRICLSLQFLGEIHLEQGRLTEALRELDEAHALAAAVAPRGDLLMGVLRARGELLAAMGRKDESRRDLDRALRLSESRGEPLERVRTKRAIAFLAATDAADLGERLQRVLREFEAMGDRFEYAWTVYQALSDGRLQLGESPWLAEACTAALHYFSALGSRPWAQRLEAVVKTWRENAAPAPSRAFLHAIDAARLAARSSAPVLILGETGVGKELIARWIHEWSARATERLVTINCGALPDDLVESELFGHARGAFTGAERDKVGLLESADGGTVLLDEVADLPPRTQVKLLRFLDTGEIRRLGDTRLRHANVRMLAATNADLEARVREGRFREDLFYRLNAFAVQVPPLRSRPEEILSLANLFLREAAQSQAAVELSPELQSWLQAYAWPGNVRQLRNVCQYLAARSHGRPVVGTTDLPQEMLLPARPETPLAADTVESRADGAHRERLVAALTETGGNVLQAAKRLGWGRNTMYVRMREQGLSPRQFRRPSRPRASGQRRG